MNTRILIAVVVSMFLCQQVHAQDDEPEQPEAEATELEGTWEFVTLVLPDGIHHYLGSERFEGNLLYSRSFGRDWHSGSRFSLDPSVMPAEIDLAGSMKGIYELDGDLLTICFDGPNGRPDRFESSEDYPTILWVLRRVTEEESE